MMLNRFVSRTRLEESLSQAGKYTLSLVHLEELIACLEHVHRA